MTDIVERLRTDVLWHQRRGNETIAADCREAADEIERLRAELAEEREAAWATVNEMIKPGDLGGDGWDKTAERNGLILAANVLMARKTQGER